MKSFKKNIPIIPLILVFLLNQASEATPFVLKHFSQDNGFIYPSATAIEKDKLGYLWISSQDGLSRFDGSRFKTFTKIPYKKNTRVI